MPVAVMRTAEDLQRLEGLLVARPGQCPSSSGGLTEDLDDLTVKKRKKKMPGLDVSRFGG